MFYISSGTDLHHAFAQSYCGTSQYKTDLSLNFRTLLPFSNGPIILFMDGANKSYLNDIMKIRKNNILKKVSIAVFAPEVQADSEEEAFVAGANVNLHSEIDFCKLKIVMRKVMKVNMQFFSENFNRDTYFFSC